MKRYLVGGAVRDQLLGIPVEDRDWVVVGETIENMIQKDYKPIGKDFPVFLHPITKEEHALARTERCLGKGHKNFVFYTNPSITLEQDLARRDITINAIAQDESGHIIDPYHGQQDLKNRIIRHVSPAFIEDPLRVLRVGRFLAKLHNFGFTLHPDTEKLIKKLINEKKLIELSSERIAQETIKALATSSPDIYIDYLVSLNALSFVFPWINQQQNPQFGDYKKILKKMVSNNENPYLRFSCLHIPENLAIKVETLENEIKSKGYNKKYSYLAFLVASQYAILVNSIFKATAKPETILTFFKKTHAFNPNKNYFNDFIKTSIYLMHAQNQKLVNEKIKYIKNQLEGCLDISPKDWIKKGINGKALAIQLRNAQLANIHRNHNNAVHLFTE